MRPGASLESFWQTPQPQRARLEVIETELRRRLKGGRLMVNHWTLSDPGWGGGPPIGDAFMYIKYIEIYYD
jgi:hypothetical protein